MMTSHVLTAFTSTVNDVKSGRVADPRTRPIDYIDPAPKPFTVQIPLFEYFERIKRLRTDKWQKDFCARLEKAAVDRHIGRSWALIHAEAQLGKSSILAQAYAAWLLAHDPLHRIALATYNVTRSQRHAKVVIGIMNLPIHKSIFPNKDGWVDEKTSKERWSTGARLALNDGQDSFNPVGLQSGLVGSGFDTLLIDDPYADQKEAFSETTRLNLQGFWDSTVMSRMGTYTNVFGMFHRYHVEDLAGYLLDKGTFDYWRYATVCDGPYIHDETGQKFDDPLGREIGEYISERRLPSYYAEIRKNTRIFSSMNQGRPSAEEGEFFLVKQIAERDANEIAKRRQECSVFVRAWDLAATEEGGDYSVAPLVGMSPDKRATIFHGVRKQVESAGRDALMLATAQQDGTDVVISIPQDPGAAGLTAVFHIQQLLQGFTVVTRPTSGSKEDRARSVASAVNSGQVDCASDEFLPDEEKWVKEMKREMRNFPLSEHDDFVDSVADGYNECFERISQGLVIKNFTSHNLLTFDTFKERFPNPQGFRIPAAWTVYAGLKITPDASLPNSAIIVARASENADIGEVLFVVAEYKEYTADFLKLFDWLNDALVSYCERPKATLLWVHKDSEGYVSTIRQKLQYGMKLFKEDESAGLTEIGWYLKSKDGDNPFYEGNKATGLYGLIGDASQIAVAVDDGGLSAFRQEIATWKFNDKNKPNATGAVLECLRMICYQFRTQAKPKTTEELIREQIPAEVLEAAKMATTAHAKLTSYLDLEFQREIAKETLGIEDEWSEELE